MQRSIQLARLCRRFGLAILAFSLATPAFAGMTQDLADCTAADRKTSADACTRVMNSGRLPKNQFYIGHYNRGWSHFNAGAYDKALADFDKSIDYNPGYADTYMSRAQVQHERGDRERSLADLDTYLEKKGEIAEAHLNRARVFRRRGELDRAFSELQRAGSLDPTDVDVLVLRALVLSDMGEKVPARAEADKAVFAKSDEPAALYARAVVAFRDDSLEAAAADVDKALSFKDAFPAAHTLKGEIAERRNKSDAAIKSYSRALDFSPRSLDGRMAQEKARTRLSSLNGSSLVPAEVAEAASPPKPSAEPDEATKGTDCRRFIPSAGITVAVKCDE
jgi:tetratricopeptide (TPR) repeat protein